MPRFFNTEGACFPQHHYMADLNQRLAEIKTLIDKNKYFSINCGRQYGKTTTLLALEDYLKDDYITASLDFQFFTQNTFLNEASFGKSFARKFWMAVQNAPGPPAAAALEGIKKCAAEENCSLDVLFEYLSTFCAEADRPVILIIDEVDSAVDNQVFRDFLSLLRGYYIRRDRYPTFQSVILAGVYDIRRLKEKIRPDDESKKSSPWNIAVDFPVNMDLSITGIQNMLAEYEHDFHTGMNIQSMAEMLYDYTSGHPFLVSKLCRLMDERIASRPGFPDKFSPWSKEGFLEAEKILLSEKDSLFESLINKLADYPLLRKLIYSILFSGDKILFNPDLDIIDIASMFGFIKNTDNTVQIANRIFETRLYNFFLSEEEIENILSVRSNTDKKQLVRKNSLNMELILEKFMMHWNDLYHSADEKFIENNCRKFFLLYLKPIINGAGNYYIESRTRDHGRTDIIVDYCGRQYIIEIKLWRGKEYHRQGIKQLANYLESYHAKKGYLLVFNFNKKKTPSVRETVFENKTIFEAIV